MITLETIANNYKILKHKAIKTILMRIKKINLFNRII